MRPVSCLLMALILMPCARAAARLPDWAQTIANNAPVLEEGIARHPSRVLLSETLISVQTDGRYRLRRRTAVQALRHSASEVGIGMFPLAGDVEVLTSRAWHLPPEGKVRKARKGSSIDVSVTDLFLTDDMTRFIGVGGVEKGSLVFFEFEAVESPYLLVYMSYFLETAPTDISRFILDLPQGWTAQHIWLRSPGPESVQRGGSTVWEMRDLEPPEFEPLSGSPLDDAPLLLLRMVPPESAQVIPTVVSGPASFAKWFRTLTAGMDKVTPAITAKASELLDGSEQEFFNIISRSARYVRDNVRYVAKEIGEGNIKPRPADQVMNNLFGDCKDKTFLLRSLLAAGDIASYPVLVHATTPDTVSEEIPGIGSFNHMLTAIPIPDGLEVPERYARAVVEVPGIGDLLMIDTTDEFTSIGDIPALLCGKGAMVMTGQDAVALRMPDDQPGFHTVSRNLVAEVLEGGLISMRLATTRRGGPASKARYRTSSSSSDYRTDTEKVIKRLWVDSSFEEFSVEPETPAGEFTERMLCKVSAPAGSSGERRIGLFPMALEDLQRVSIRRRELPVRYDHPLMLKYRTVFKGLPPDTTLPTGREFEGDGWAVSSTYEREGDELCAEWIMTLSRREFGPDSFPELKEFWSAAKKSTSALIVIPD